MQETVVIFDMDGVLLDTERLMMSCFAEAARELGLPYLEAAYTDTLGAGEADTRAIFSAHYGDAATGEALYARFCVCTQKRLLTEGPPVREGAAELLAFLHGRGCRMAVASSNLRANIEAELSAVGLLHYFETVTSGDSVTRAKPDPEIYRCALSSLHAPGADAYAVEDAPAGVRSAAGAGLKAILVPDILRPDPAVFALAHRVLPSLGWTQAYFASIL